MLRMRLAILAAASLGLASGCANTNGNGGGFFARLCGRTRTTAVNLDPGCCASPCDAMPFGIGGCGPTCGLVGEGPILVDRGPMVVPPATMPGVPLMPEASLPLAPAPRLVPQPQSQPMPYNP